MAYAQSVTAWSIAGKKVVLLHSESDVGRVVEDGLVKAGASTLRLDIVEFTGAADDGIGSSVSPFLPVNPLEPATVRDAIAQADRRLDGLDILITLARRTLSGPVETVPFAEMIDTIGLNVRGRFEAMQAVIPILRARGSGTVLHLGTGYAPSNDRRWRDGREGKYELGELPGSCANDLLVIASREIRAQVAEFGIRVKVIHVGSLGGPHFASTGSDPERVLSAGAARLLLVCLNGVLTARGDGEELDEAGFAYPGDWCDLYVDELIDRIDEIHDRGIQRLLREIDPSTWALALQDVREAILARILANLSSGAGRRLLEDMDMLKPGHPTEGRRFGWDVERSRREIARIISKLEDAGEIVLAGSGPRARRARWFPQAPSRRER